ncbi:MAG: nitronate monooxygenase [Pseudomonadota bacterium]|nr:nitronate monooxygenase [Pseudomonadota bacterium]
MRSDAFIARLGIAYPIIQGPMGGGPSTPELTAAVCNAGALGSLGAAYGSPQRIATDIKETKSRTARPFNVNLFVSTAPGPCVDPQPMLSRLTVIHESLGIPPPLLPAPPSDPFPEQLNAVLADKPAVFSFTFGIPGAEGLARLKASGVYVIGTATTTEEAVWLERAGVDAVVAQGEEAGAHRGTFRGTFEASMVPLETLLATTLKAVDIPVIAAGGLMDGAGIARVLGVGAAAAQLGTAFLPCPESGASPAYKEAVLGARADTTVVTRVFSGRPARGLRNAFVDALEGCLATVLPYPLQNALTRAMRDAAARLGDARYLSLWAGQGVAHARQMPAAQLVRTLVDEMKAARP